MGNFVPKLIGCGAPDEESVSSTLELGQYHFQPCCIVRLKHSVGTFTTLDHLFELKAEAWEPCLVCCSLLPMFVEHVMLNAEHTASGIGMISGYVLALHGLLEGGDWGILLDRRLGTDMTLGFCEWLERIEDYSLDTHNRWKWQTVLRFVDNGLNTGKSRTLILRALWKERQAARAASHAAYMTAGCVMVRRGVPRDVRLMIYARTGAYSRQSWHSWSTKLPALAVLWSRRRSTKDLCTEAQKALEHVIYALCERHSPDEGHEQCDTILHLLKKNTRLFARSAWLHWAPWYDFVQRVSE